jgi:hypothetical protein
MADRLTNNGDSFCLIVLDMAIEDYLFLGGVCYGAKSQCHKAMEYVFHRDDK